MHKLEIAENRTKDLEDIDKTLNNDSLSDEQKCQRILEIATRESNSFTTHPDAKAFYKAIINYATTQAPLTRESELDKALSTINDKCQRLESSHKKLTGRLRDVMKDLHETTEKKITPHKKVPPSA